ncbi:MAG: molybdopterin-guanine dinucleotide biosynthesis protein B [Candidatus Bathyarchaeia archaeon]
MHRKSPVMIFVVGTSGSGKTTTIEYLTSHLTQLGFHVGIVKHIHEGGLNLDTRGKDTWRHARAGADLIVGVAPRELLLFKKTSSETRLDNVLSNLRSESIDVLFMEGYSANSSKHSYKIVTANDLADLKRTLRKSLLPILAITGPVARSSKPRLRTLALPSQGVELTAIVRRLIRPKELQDCLRKASKAHGGSCVGLAVGLRASYLVSNILGELSSGLAIFGTKRCITEAFRYMYPKLRIKLKSGRDDLIIVRKEKVKVLLQLAPKKEYGNATRVLDVPDAELFESVKVVEQK